MLGNSIKINLHSASLPAAARQGDFRGEKFKVFRRKTLNFSPLIPQSEAAKPPSKNVEGAVI